MARVLFKRDFDYKPSSEVTIAFVAGEEKTVKQECAEQAEAAGAGEWLDKPAPEKSAPKAAKRKSNTADTAAEAVPVVEEAQVDDDSRAA